MRIEREDFPFLICMLGIAMTLLLVICGCTVNLIKVDAPTPDCPKCEPCEPPDCLKEH